MNTYSSQRSLGGQRSALIHLGIAPSLSAVVLLVSSASQRARKCIRCLIQSYQERRLFKPNQSSLSSSYVSAHLVLFLTSSVTLIIDLAFFSCSFLLQRFRVALRRCYINAGFRHELKKLQIRASEFGGFNFIFICYLLFYFFPRYM